MPEILLTIERARRRDRIPRILLDAQVVAVCQWDPDERAHMEMDREQAVKLANFLNKELFNVVIVRAVDAMVSEAVSDGALSLTDTKSQLSD